MGRRDGGFVDELESRARTGNQGVIGEAIYQSRHARREAMDFRKGRFVEDGPLGPRRHECQLQIADRVVGIPGIEIDPQVDKVQQSTAEASGLGGVGSEHEREIPHAARRQLHEPQKLRHDVGPRLIGLIQQKHGRFALQMILLKPFFQPSGEPRRIVSHPRAGVELHGQLPLEFTDREAQEIQPGGLPVFAGAFLGEQLQHQRFAPTRLAEHEPQATPVVYQEPQAGRGFLLRQPRVEHWFGGSRGEGRLFQSPVRRVHHASLESSASARHNAVGNDNEISATIGVSAPGGTILRRGKFCILNFTFCLLASLASAMTDRYFSDEPLEESPATLRGKEAHHLLHVMRAKVGTEIIVFDGRGGEWWAEVTKLSRTEVELALRKHRHVERELTVEFTLAVALPKGDRQRWLVEKAAELGVTRLVPLTTARSMASTAEPAAKLARYVIEASKQCGRNRLMEITKPQAWGELVSQDLGANKFVAHPGGVGVGELQRVINAATFLAIGPEGGFTDDEISLAREAGWQIVGLGTRILRIETAALALVAQLTA